MEEQGDSYIPLTKLCLWGYKKKRKLLAILTPIGHFKLICNNHYHNIVYKFRINLVNMNNGKIHYHWSFGFYLIFILCK